MGAGGFAGVVRRQGASSTLYSSSVPELSHVDLLLSALLQVRQLWLYCHGPAGGHGSVPGNLGHRNLTQIASPRAESKKVSVCRIIRLVEPKAVLGKPMVSTSQSPLNLAKR